jgi:formylglycine-generating enzyme required for sulfatase activity
MRFSFGNEESALGEYAWHNEESGSRTHPVGKKKANAFGLHDMHGNVWEWCWDWFAADYSNRSPTDDPRGPEKASVRVVRGGGWLGGPRYVRSAVRDGWGLGVQNNILGFRLARGPSGR